MTEYKAFPGAIAVKEVNGRTVTGIASVLGNRDDYDDIIWPGAYAKTLNENARRIKHFWQHAWMTFTGVAEPPIAAITDIREVSRDALPESVLSIAPEALGGLEVTRTYLNTPRGNEVLEGIKAGVITEMSIGFVAVKYDYDEADGVMVRNLREVRLLETSDVIWGANDATAASKAQPDYDFILRLLERSAKAGRRNNSDDQQRINDICRLAYELGADFAPEMPDDSEDETPLSEKAEPERTTPPLTLQRRARLMGIRLALAGVHSE